MNKHTALYDAHLKAGARMVPFAGWDMPLHYGSQVKEHHQVRRAAGMFDVSHMTVLDFSGADALRFLQKLLASDVGRLVEPGLAQYGLMLNERAGIIDDLISYRRATGYRLVTNAGTHKAVCAWIASRQKAFAVDVAEQDLAMLAVQGPRALATMAKVLGHDKLDDLASFQFLEDGDCLIARTGYTGEDGVELILPGTDARRLWDELSAAGVTPAGLGARDTLRCEAGLNLYGQDMNEDTDPLISNLGWTVAWQPENRDFVGRAVLTTLRDNGPQEKLTGLVLEGKGVLRRGQRLETSAGDGVVTSGIFSPTLGYSIALARLPRSAKGRIEVAIRNNVIPAIIVKPPFVRNGRRTVAARSNP